MCEHQRHPKKGSPRNARLDHAMSYATIRALEMDLAMELSTLIENKFKKNASSGQKNNPQGAGA